MESIYQDNSGMPLVPVISLEIAAGKMVAKSHAGTGCRCGACQSYGGEFRPLSKTQIKKLNASNAQLRAALKDMLQADDAICENVGTKSDQAMNRIAAIDTARAAIANAGDAIREQFPRRDFHKFPIQPQELEREDATNARAAVPTCEDLNCPCTAIANAAGTTPVSNNLMRDFGGLANIDVSESCRQAAHIIYSPDENLFYFEACSAALEFQTYLSQTFQTESGAWRSLRKRQTRWRLT